MSLITFGVGATFATGNVVGGIEPVIKAAESLGPGWTLAIIAAIYVLTSTARVYQDWQKRNDRREEVKLANEQIERLAEENRTWRTYFFMHTGLTQEQAESLVNNAEFPAGANRDSFEEHQNGKKSGSKKKGQSKRRGSKR